MNTKLAKLITKHNESSLYRKKRLWVNDQKMYYTIHDRKKDIKKHGINYVINEKNLIHFLYFNDLHFLLAILDTERINSKDIVTEEVKTKYQESLDADVKIPRYEE